MFWSYLHKIHILECSKNIMDYIVICIATLRLGTEGFEFL